VFRTDLNGTVIVEVVPGGAYQVRVERGEGAQPPPTPVTPSPATFAAVGTAMNQSSSAPLPGVIVQVLDGLNATGTAFVPLLRSRAGHEWLRNQRGVE